MWYDFLLKGMFRQTLITTIVIDFSIIIVLHDLNSLTKGTRGLMSWNTKLFPQNLRYRHKERRNAEGSVKESKL